jgi:MFS family permease
VDALTSKETTLVANMRAMPPAVWVLCAGTFVNRFGTFVMPFLILYLTRTGYTIAQAGLAVGAYGAGHLAASMLGGHLADRIGRRNTIALSMFSSAAAMLALSQAHGFVPVVAITLFVGMSSELYRPASHALIGDLVTPEQRVTAFGLYRFAVNLGFAAGPATAGFIAERSFVYLFIGDAVTSVGYGAIALFALPHGNRGFHSGERIGEAFQVAIRDRRFVTFLLATLCVTLVDFQMGSTFALYVRAQGFSTATYGLLISFNGMLIVAFELVLTAWTQRRSPRPVIALGYFLSCLGFALTGLAHSVLALAATVVVWTAGEMIASPMAGAYATHLAPERYRGRYMGLLVLMWSLGMMFGPPLGTLAFQYNATILWTVCGILGVISATLAMSSRTRSA